MESFSEIKGRPFLVGQLIRPVKNGRISGAQIFAGPSGTGKLSAAKLIAKAVNCTGYGEKPCGKCPSCLRFQSGNAQELTLIEPDGKSIKIERIRALIDDIALRPDGTTKCVIISEADKMTQQAQNALLKTLEEAPEYALFFLITDCLNALLPTIRSRCAILRFAPLEEGEVVGFLTARGVSEEKAKGAARAGGGSIGKALSILNDNDYQMTSLALSKALEGIKPGGPIAETCAAFMQFKDNVPMLLEQLEEAARELMRAKYIKGAELGTVAATLYKNKIDGALLLKSVIGCANMINANVSYQNAAEMLLFDITSQEDS